MIVGHPLQFEQTAIEPTAGLGSGLGLQGGFPAAWGQRVGAKKAFVGPLKSPSAIHGGIHQFKDPFDPGEQTGGLQGKGFGVHGRR